MNDNQNNFYRETTYRELVKPYLDEAKKELINYLSINSVYDEKTITEKTPYGQGVEKALTFLADLGKRLGFNVDRVDHHCTELSYGEGKLLDIYAHADVVPVSENWVHKPFEPTIEGDKIFARGACDDKGPGLASLFAAKALLDNNKLNCFKLRIIFGGDEERGSSCLEYYFNEYKKEYPTYGFTPDADFPMIYAEKSIHTVELIKECPKLASLIEDFDFGKATNIVLDEATAILKKVENLENKVKHYQENHKDINLVLNDNTLKFFGKSVHGATPWLGVNAGLHLLNFFGEEYGIEELCKLFIALEKGDGKSFGGDFTSETFDSTSYAIGKMNFKNNTIKLIINLRLPENVNISEPIEKLEKFTSSKCNDLGGCDALVIPLESTLVQTLCNVYKEETGDEINKPLAIGGGTYAKESKNSLAFGPTFPGRDFFIHQDDEYFFISDFENIIGIYAHAIDALGKALRENK